MLKFHKELKFESLHCSLQVVWTVKINTNSVSSHELLPRKVKPHCSPDMVQQQGHKSPNCCSPAQCKQCRQDGVKDTVEQEGDRRAVAMITKGKFVMLSVVTKDNKIVV